MVMMPRANRSQQVTMRPKHGFYLVHRRPAAILAKKHQESGVLEYPNWDGSIWKIEVEDFPRSFCG